MEANQQANKPKTLQKIAYVSIPDSTDLEFLLWDLQDAIAAYAQLSGTALPRPVDLKANDAGSVADGIVLAIEDVADDETLTAIEQALERFGSTGTRVYAVIRAAQEGTEQARGTAVRLHKACERHDQLWCGGVAICAGSGIARPVQAEAASFPGWCTVPTAVRSCITGRRTITDRRARSLTVLSIRSTRTSAVLITSGKPYSAT